MKSLRFVTSFKNDRWTKFNNYVRFVKARNSISISSHTFENIPLGNTRPFDNHSHLFNNSKYRIRFDAICPTAFSQFKYNALNYTITIHFTFYVVRKVHENVKINFHPFSSLDEYRIFFWFCFVSFRLIWRMLWNLHLMIMIMIRAGELGMKEKIPF